MSNPLSDGWGGFLGQFHWDWFVTLTFARDVKSFTAHNRCNAWLHSLEKAAGHPIAWFRGDECGNRFGKFHMHLLIANVAHLHRFTWMGRWEARNGWARIFEFNPTLGASYYVAKYVTKQFGEWELSDNIAAFRIQQPVFPLVDQRGTNSITWNAADQRFTSRRSRYANKQLPLSDFTEPHLSDLDDDEIRTIFHEQTKRNR
jgi:hypothetical protein